MKSTRLQRAWQFWLDLPAGARMGIIIAVVIIVGLFWPKSSKAEESRSVPVLALCQNGKLVGIQLIAPAPDVYTVRIGEHPCEPAKAPAPRPPASRTT